MATTSTPADTPPYLSMGQVCEMLHVSRFTIDRWVRGGSFPAPLRIGRRVLFVAGEVRAHLDALHRQRAPRAGDS